jgi:Arc/MetJ-type ribon-helix-helix transcriptional regulator
MTIRLPKELERSIQAEVLSGRFASEEALVTEAVREYLRSLRQSSDANRPIWERIQERVAVIPDAEFDKLPTDLAEQHDHYLYGTPKRPTQ